MLVKGSYFAKWRIHCSTNGPGLPCFYSFAFDTVSYLKSQHVKEGGGRGREGEKGEGGEGEKGERREKRVKVN